MFRFRGLWGFASSDVPMTFRVEGVLGDWV